MPKKILWLIGFVLMCSTAQADSAIRALWVTQKYLESPQSINEVMQKAKAAKINTLFVQVRARGTVSYRSRLEQPYSPLQNNSDFDPLALVLEKAKPLGISVHAWVNVFYVWSERNRPSNPNHIVNRQPGWILQKKGQVFLNPSNLDVQNYSQEVIREIALNYPVDGIHLDYFRYPSRVKKVEWIKVRQHYLKNFLALLWEWKTARFPALKLSVAVTADYHKASKIYSQDWKDWMHAGILDWAVPMIYQKDSKKFKSELDFACREAQSTPVKVVAGVGMWQLSDEQFRKQLSMVQAKWREMSPNPLGGISLFAYEGFSPVRQKIWLETQ